MSMNIRLSTKVDETSNFVDKEFDGLVQAQKYLSGFSFDSFYAIELIDNFTGDYFDSWESIHQYINSSLKPLGKAVPQYMFKDTPVDNDIAANTDLDWYELEGHIFMLVNPVTREYCYVYTDECDQPSKPYPTLADAHRALSVYMRNL